MIGGSGEILLGIALLRTFLKLLDSFWEGLLGWYAPDPFGIGLYAGIGGMRGGRPGAGKCAVSASIFIIYIIKNRINMGYDFISK